MICEHNHQKDFVNFVELQLNLEQWRAFASYSKMSQVACKSQRETDNEKLVSIILIYCHAHPLNFILTIYFPSI